MHATFSPRRRQWAIFGRVGAIFERILLTITCKSDT